MGIHSKQRQSNLETNKQFQLFDTILNGCHEVACKPFGQVWFSSDLETKRTSCQDRYGEAHNWKSCLEILLYGLLGQ